MSVCNVYVTTSLYVERVKDHRARSSERFKGDWSPTLLATALSLSLPRSRSLLLRQKGRRRVHLTCSFLLVLLLYTLWMFAQSERARERDTTFEPRGAGWCNSISSFLSGSTRAYILEGKVPPKKERKERKKRIKSCVSFLSSRGRLLSYISTTNNKRRISKRRPIEMVGGPVSPVMPFDNRLRLCTCFGRKGKR